MIIKQTTSILLLIVLALAAFMSGCGVGQATVADIEEIEAATPVPVEVAHPLRADVFATHKVTATITSDADAPVLAKVPGEVIELLVEEGDRTANACASNCWRHVQIWSGRAKSISATSICIPVA
jgi:multidrug efflux pump subunit AcrA (membrane-fusion protein)